MPHWAAYFGIAGTTLSLAGAILGRPGKGRRGFLLAVAGIVLGALAFGVPGNWYRIARGSCTAGKVFHPEDGDRFLVAGGNR